MFPITPLRNMIEVMGESLVKGREMTDKPIFVIWSGRPPRTGLPGAVGRRSARVLELPQRHHRR